MSHLPTHQYASIQTREYQSSTQHTSGGYSSSTNKLPTRPQSIASQAIVSPVVTTVIGESETIESGAPYRLQPKVSATVGEPTVTKVKYIKDASGRVTKQELPGSLPPDFDHWFSKGHSPILVNAPSTSSLHTLNMTSSVVPPNVMGSPSVMSSNMIPSMASNSAFMLAGQSVMERGITEELRGPGVRVARENISLEHLNGTDEALLLLTQVLEGYVRSRSQQEQVVITADLHTMLTIVGK
eukprot:Blabericola_migrator_1__5609@NODE_2853_length_2284_cov_156_691024_g1789_i0_p1_GENE_NODE_2853_length_2284_cov_156_691024_g1789_i0NODE_2853_length_2284_cov_156_691024_g1789_i0_p1_ORF_typecomplete_len241_score29_22_NODE_2853_length_2284_cov_156_691024_g1789_i0156878